MYISRRNSADFFTKPSTRPSDQSFRRRYFSNFLNPPKKEPREDSPPSTTPTANETPLNNFSNDRKGRWKILIGRWVDRLDINQWTKNYLYLMVKPGWSNRFAGKTWHTNFKFYCYSLQVMVVKQRVFVVLYLLE